MKGKRMPVWPMVVGLAAAVVLLVLGGYILERSAGGPEKEGPGKTVEELLGKGDEAPVSFNGKQYRRDPDVEAYLFMGVDKTGEAIADDRYNGGGQADVLLLLVVDQGQKSFRVLQINRDTMADMDVLGVRGDVVGTEFQQICLAHHYGNGLEKSCENTVKAVSGLLYGVDIDGYAAVQMEAIPVLNDMVGGVTVTIEDDFSQTDPTLIQGETVTLRGEQALRFVRGRMSVGDGTNLARMRRHRAYMHGFEEAFTAAAGADRELVLKMYDAAHDYLVTDMGSKSITNLAEQCLGYENGGVVMVEGEGRIGRKYYEYYLDETSLRETVLELFYAEMAED